MEGSVNEQLIAHAADELVSYMSTELFDTFMEIALSEACKGDNDLLDQIIEDLDLEEHNVYGKMTEAMFKTLCLAGTKLRYFPEPRQTHPTIMWRAS